MKLFSYILAFYLVLLSAVPCCAFDNCPDDKVVTEKTTGQQSGDDNDCGSCSPFFNCEGCAFVMISTTPGFFSPIILPASKIYTEFLAAFVTDVHYDFWQPPKLG